MLTTIREMWRDEDGIGRMLLVMGAVMAATMVSIPVLAWRDYRDAAARFDACVRAGGTVAVSTSGERWCTRGGVR